MYAPPLYTHSAHDSFGLRWPVSAAYATRKGNCSTAGGKSPDIFSAAQGKLEKNATRRAKQVEKAKSYLDIGNDQDVTRCRGGLSCLCKQQH